MTNNVNNLNNSNNLNNKNNVFNSVHNSTSKTKLLISLIVCAVVIAIIGTYIANNAIKNGKFTCQKYVLNTYIYICLSFLLIALENLVLEHQRFKFDKIGGYIWLIVILMFASIIAIHFIPRTNLPLKHLVWLIFILGAGFIFHPLYIVSRYTKTFISALLTVAILVVLITFFVFLKPELVSLKMGPVLFWLLLIGIVMEIVSRFIIKDKEKKVTSYKLFSYFFIVLFTGYLLYDTRKLQENAKTCIESLGADYIGESLGMFLDIFNILVRVMGLKAMRS